MDLATQQKLIRLLWGRCPHDEPLRFLWEHQRQLSWQRPAFVKAAMRVSNEIFLAQFKDKRTLDKSFRSVVSKVKALGNSPFESLRREIFHSIKNFFDDNTSFLRLRKTRIECREYIQCVSESHPEHSCTGPPKGFVPLPDAETGGCARNDSLIAPLVN